VITVQRILVPDTKERSWVLFDGGAPVLAANQYLLYLHHLGRSPNTVRAYAHHLQAFSHFLSKHGKDWKTLSLTELAQFVAWLRRCGPNDNKPRSNTTINTILAAASSFYEYHDRMGIETPISRSRRFGAKSAYKPLLHHISRNGSLRRAVMQVRATRRLPRVFSSQEVQSLIDACTRRRDRLLVSLLYDSGMRIGQALGLRHADIRSYDSAIDIVPRSNRNGAFAKTRSPYTVHVSKELMELYADYLVYEYQETDHDYVFVNCWGGRIGAPMNYSAVIDLFRRLSAKTCLPATPHMFRHTHATDLLRAGWDAAYIQRRLGHAQIQTTINTYAHLSTGDMGRMFARYQQERAK
jgi:integrase/recombinase XerD